MASPKEEEKLNPGKNDYENKFGDGSSYSPTAQKNNESLGNQGSQESTINDQERKGGLYKPSEKKRPKRTKFAAKSPVKRWGAVGVISILTLLSGGIGIIGSQATMLSHLSRNAQEVNDSLTPAMQRRFQKIFGNMSSGDASVLCTGARIKAKCHMSRLSNNALKTLQRKGVTAVFEGNIDYDGKRTGMPDKKITGYKIDGREGVVAAKDLQGELANDKKLASKVLGTRGAFNLRFKSWTSKTMNNVLSKLKITRNGGLADGKNKKGSTANDMIAKLKEKVPGIEGASEVKANLETKLSSRLRIAGKASVGYTATLAGCMVLKGPKYIAAGVAAYQLAQLLPLAMETVLSPASKTEASGVFSNMSPEDMEAVTVPLTEKTPSPNDPDKLTSAMDSKYLLAAIGLGSGRLPVSEKFSPGYSVISNSLVKGGTAAERATGDACNIISNPITMYSAMAVEGGIALALPGVGHLVKFAAGFAIGEIASRIVPGIITMVGDNVIKSIAENDYIRESRGEERGDAIGMSLLSLFSVGGASAGLSVLSENQNIAFNEMRLEDEAYLKEVDIAGLSPFDISSKYTFLGSIVNNMKSSMLLSGFSTDSPASIISSILSIPSTILTPGTKVSAASSQAPLCNYAEEFDMSTGNSSTTPAVNVAGLPCVGLTQEQAAMSTDEAIDLVSEWLDEEAEYPEGATAFDLLETGYIIKETPLADYIQLCGNPESGDYLNESSGCMFTGSSSVATLPNVTNSVSVDDFCIAGDDGTEHCQGDPVYDGENEIAQIEQTYNERQLSAIVPFLLDLQLSQSINYEGFEETASQDSSSINSSPDINGNTVQYYQNEDPWKSQSYGTGTIQMCGCGPTTIASIVSTFYPEKQVNPKQVADHFVSIGGQNIDCGSKWTAWESSVTQEKYGISVTSVAPSAANATKGLEEGGLVLLSVGKDTPFTTGGHIMMIRGKAGNNFLVGDPNSRSRSQNNSGFSVDQFNFGLSTGTKGMWIVKKAA